MIFVWFIDYSDSCCFFSLNYRFAAVVLIATNKVGIYLSLFSKVLIFVSVVVVVN